MLAVTGVMVYLIIFGILGTDVIHHNHSNE
jgi:hypothetical protein